MSRPFSLSFLVSTNDFSSGDPRLTFILVLFLPSLALLRTHFQCQNHGLYSVILSISLVRRGIASSASSVPNV